MSKLNILLYHQNAFSILGEQFLSVEEITNATIGLKESVLNILF